MQHIHMPLRPLPGPHHHHHHLHTHHHHRHQRPLHLRLLCVLWLRELPVAVLVSVPIRLPWRERGRLAMLGE